MPADRRLRPSGALLVSLAALTASGLALEVGLTRFFSFLFLQSSVYLIVTVSVAGLGLGGVAMALVPQRRRDGVVRWLAAVPPLFVFALLAAALAAPTLPIAVVAMTGLFMAIGATQVSVFRSARIRVARLYAADLVGAAVGSVASFLLLTVAAAPVALALLALVASLATTLIAHLLAPAADVVAGERRGRARRAVPATVGVALAIAAVALPVEERALPDGRWEKELTSMLADGGAITDTRWSAFGRVDLVETENPYFRTMFIDGGAGTKMVAMPEGRVTRDVAETLLYQYMVGVPLLPVPEDLRRRAAVIGAGGGIDVVTLLLAGVASIDAIEINPDFVRLVRENGDYTGDLYDAQEAVTVHIAEGRAFIRAADDPYDLIVMSLPIIKSARNFGNHALTENYLFTVDAFTDYRRALAPDGRLVIVAHYRNELLRVVTNALASFEASGVSAAEAVASMVVIADPLNPTLVLRGSPFPDEERAGYAAIVNAVPTTPDLNFVPGAPESAASALTMNRSLRAIEAGRGSIGTIVASASENVSPVTDERPFFYQLTTRLPRETRAAGLTVAGLLLAVALAFTSLVREPAIPTVGARAARVTAFALLGVGYMLVELAVIQRFIVFWHHQTLALAVVLAAILTASGLGSALSARIRRRRGVILVFGWIIAAGALAGVALAPLLRAAEGASVGLRIVITFGVALILFTPMGMPFPLLLERTPKRLFPWLMGTNAIASLAGGVATIALAISVGYRAVASAGVVTYAVVLVLVLSTKDVVSGDAVMPLHSTDQRRAEPKDEHR